MLTKASKLIAIIIITIILTGCAAEVEPSGDPVAAIVSGHHLQIERQPHGNKAYVTDSPETLTLVDAEALFLLAHDHLAGQYIAGLVVGDEVVIQLQTGQVEYAITSIERFTAVDPYNPHSNLVDDTGYELLTAQVHWMIMGVADRLVFQTCFDNSTGRMFVIAERN